MQNTIFYLSIFLALSVLTNICFSIWFYFVRKRFKKLKSEELFLQKILDTAPIGIGLVTNRILGWGNKEFYKMLERPFGELQGQNAVALYPSKEEYDRVAAIKHPQILEEGIGIIETKFCTKSGKLIDIILSSSAIKPGNLEKGIIFTAQDISKQKETERKLLEANADLKQFAFATSHDIKEPIRTIQNFTEMGFDLLHPDQKEKMETWRNYIITSCQQLDQLVNGITSYLKTGHDQLNKSKVSLTDIIDKAKFFLNSSISKENATITYGKLPEVNVSFPMFVQVFQNLIQNSLKFHKSDIPPSIAIKYENTQNSHRIYFQDNGIGISTYMKDKIFTPFQREHSKFQYPGSGIGLSIVRKIIERHEGSIFVESELGKGTTFIIDLPY